MLSSLEIVFLEKIANVRILDTVHDAVHDATHDATHDVVHDALRFFCFHKKKQNHTVKGCGFVARISLSSFVPALVLARGKENNERE